MGLRRSPNLTKLAPPGPTHPPSLYSVQPPPWPPAGWGQLPCLPTLTSLFLKPLPIPAESGVQALRLSPQIMRVKWTHKQVPRELVKGEDMVGRDQMTFLIKCLLCDRAPPCDKN